MKGNQMAGTVRRQTTKRRKKAPLPRKPRTGIGAAPDHDWEAFASYFRMDMDRKDVAGVLRNYIRSNYEGEERKLLLSAPDYMYTTKYGPAASIAWAGLGKEFPPKWNHENSVNLYIENLRKTAIDKLSQKNDSDTNTENKPVISPMERVKRITSEFIGSIEEIIDDWQNVKDFNMYKEMQLADLNGFSAKAVFEFYKPQRDEIYELVNDKPEDLVEAYSYLTVPTRKKYLSFFEGIISDVEKYILSKKAVRKPSKPRVKSADKQVAKVSYAKDSAEFKLTSIDPMLIVGSRRLYTFHIKERIITEFITESATGFEISGTTIKNFDPVNSRAIRLRKPEEMLGTFQTKTPNQIDKFWKELTTKTVKPNGRINKDTILLRVLDK
jgi:hypothetical protein